MTLTIKTIHDAIAKMDAILADRPPPFSGEIAVCHHWPLQGHPYAWAIFPPHPLWLAVWRLCRVLRLPRIASPWTRAPMYHEADPTIILGRLHMSVRQYEAFKAHADDLAVFGSARTLLPLGARPPFSWTP